MRREILEKLPLAAAPYADRRGKMDIVLFTRVYRPAEQPDLIQLRSPDARRFCRGLIQILFGIAERKGNLVKTDHSGLLFKTSKCCRLARLADIALPCPGKAFLHGKKSRKRLREIFIIPFLFCLVKRTEIGSPHI